MFGCRYTSRICQVGKVVGQTFTAYCKTKTILRLESRLIPSKAPTSCMACYPIEIFTARARLDTTASGREVHGRRKNGTSPSILGIWIRVTLIAGSETEYWSIQVAIRAFRSNCITRCLLGARVQDQNRQAPRNFGISDGSYTRQDLW